MPKSAKPTLHRDAWLRQALDVLFSQGISNVKVEILARELDVTKGSFYWHFKNRDELLRAVVDWWRDNQIEFIGQLDVSHIGDAPNLIKSVIDFTDHTDDSRHDVAMREFARFNDYRHGAGLVREERRGGARPHASHLPRLDRELLMAFFENARTSKVWQGLQIFFYNFDGKWTI